MEYVVGIGGVVDKAGGDGVVGVREVVGSGLALVVDCWRWIWQW